MSVNYNFSHLNIAVIGCGNWGKNLIRVLNELGALCAVVDRDQAKANFFSEKYNIPHYSLEEVLAQQQIDGVLIATPSPTHYHLALNCLQAKKHVFIEKPMTLEVDHALTLKDFAYQQQRTLMVGHLLQYHPVFNALKKMTLEGELGQLFYINSSRYNFGKFPSEENVFWDFAPHDISMILALMGEMPHRVFATQGNFLHHTIADTTSVHLDFAANRQAHIAVSWLHPLKEQKLLVVGSKGMALFNDCQPWENKLQLHAYPAEWQDGLPRPFPNQAENVSVPFSEPLLNELSHFLHCIVEQKSPLTNANEAIGVMTVLETALQSINLQQPIVLRPGATAFSKQYDMIEESAQLDVSYG